MLTIDFVINAISLGSLYAMIALGLVIGGILLLLNDISTVYSRKNLPVPAQPPEAGELHPLEQGGAGKEEVLVDRVGKEEVRGAGGRRGHAGGFDQEVPGREAGVPVAEQGQVPELGVAGKRMHLRWRG